MKHLTRTEVGRKIAINLAVGIFLQALIALAFESGGIVSGTIAKFLLDTENVKWVSGEPEQVIKELEEQGYQSAVLAGGATINSMFLEKKLIDEMIITIEPKIFGTGISLFNQEVDIDLELIDATKITDNAIVLRYKINY